MTKYREILRLKSLGFSERKKKQKKQKKEHRTELRCIQKHSR